MTPLACAFDMGISTQAYALWLSKQVSGFLGGIFLTLGVILLPVWKLQTSYRLPIERIHRPKRHGISYLRTACVSPPGFYLFDHHEKVP